MAKMKLLGAVLGSALCAGLYGCDDNAGTADAGGTTNPDAAPRADATVDAGVPDTGGGNPDAATPTCTAWNGSQPADTVAINFTIDDSANQTYTSTDGLAWKGSMSYDDTTRCITRDPSWGNGAGFHAFLFDDGPWSTGGHEPMGATAGDHIFGVTVFFLKPTEPQMFEYGAVAGWVNGVSCDQCWIWKGGNGTFTVPANADTPINTTGLVIAPFGTIDFRLLVDTSTLAPEFSGFNPANGIKVKSSQWGWSEIDTKDDGTAGDVTAADGIFTFRYSDHAGRGALRHFGLMATGDTPEWVFTLGGVEYKVANMASAQGVTAQVKAQGAADWTTVTIGHAGNGNTTITVP